MDIDILEYIYKPSKTKLGHTLVKYHDIVLRCEVCFYPKNKTLWLRMPEYWLNPTNKFRYAYWMTKDKSNEFQEAVLNVLRNKFDLDNKKAQQLHETACKERGLRKKNGQDLKEELL